MGINLKEEIEKRNKYFEMLLRVTKHTVSRQKILKEYKEFKECFVS